MNNADFHRDRSSLQLLGKEFIIVVVVIFSALSFTLGYFVGKSSIDRKPENLSQPAEITPAPQKQVSETLPQPQSSPVAENTPRTEEAAKDVQAQKKGPFVIVEAKQPGPAKSLHPAKEKIQAQTVSQQIPKVGLPKVGALATEPPKENNQKPAAKESPVSQDSKQSDESLYTVQIGAFKSSAEAETFRGKYAKKGLKTYITTSANTKKEKIYKVKSGEFKDRKKAEVLSLKLNKTEKLKTFVTLKNE